MHPRFGTPYGSIIVAALLHAILASGSFAFLLAIDVLLFVLSYVLIFVAGFVLRVKQPELERPFRVPVGAAGFAWLAGVPLAVAVLFLAANGARALAFGAMAAVSGPVAYAIVASRRAG